MPQIRTLEIITSTPIKFSEVRLFRGAVINSLDEKLVLFHNHDDDGFRYSYPLIQYKRINGNAAIVCVEKGTEEIGERFASKNLSLRLGERMVELDVTKMNAFLTDVKLIDGWVSYRLSNWLPLNSDNYAKYISTDSLVEKLGILENVLIGNMMSFLKGVGIHMDLQFNAKITTFRRESVILFKDVKMMNFYIDFKTNLWLPNHIGIGKGASVGFGVITRLNENQNIK